MVTLLFIASCSSGLRPVCAGEASTCKLNPGTPARLAMAKAAIDSAFRVRPDSGEAHLALSWHLYWGYSDYARARAELALAQQSLPSAPQANKNAAGPFPCGQHSDFPARIATRKTPG